MEYYLSKMLSANDEVNRLKEENASMNAKIKKEPALETFYFHTSGAIESIRSLNELVQLLDFFEIEWFEDNKHKFMKRLTELIDSLPSDASVASVKCEIISEIFKRIFEKIEPKLTAKIKSLSIEENRRLNEAFNCYLNELNYSSIVMSVSTIECRLFSLMRSRNNDSKLEGLTLGQLIREYADNKGKYGYIIPKKHEPLLDYCNTYRIFSVHQKKDKITRSNATTVLCMACSFLFDQSLNIELKEEG